MNEPVRPHPDDRVSSSLAALVACVAGAAILIIEIAGIKLLAPAFGSAFHVWTGQIGVVMVALALGYELGGRLIDRMPSIRVVAALLLASGLITAALPTYTRALGEAISSRHFPKSPETESTADYEAYLAAPDPEIPAIWQKLDPMLGSFAAFFLPCCLLAGVGPCFVRLLHRDAASAGAGVGRVLAWSTIGSIAGVFLTAYLLLDLLSLTAIMRATGGLLVLCSLPLWTIRTHPPAPAPPL